MSVSDWAAAASTLVAFVALGFSIYGINLQRGSQKDDSAERFGQTMHDLQKALQPLSHGLGDDAASLAANGDALVEVQVLALRAEELAKEPGVQPSWFNYVVLGIAFAQVWDVVKAEGYWLKALASARDPQSQVIVLRNRATFLFTVGRPEDIAAARTTFDQALKVLDPKMLSPDLVMEQNVGTLTSWAGLEMMVGNLGDMQTLVTRAWNEAAALQSPWRMRRAETSIAVPIAQSGLPDAALQGLPIPLLAQVQLLRQMAAAGAQAGPAVPAGPGLHLRPAQRAGLA